MPSNLFRISDSQIWKTICFKDVPIFACIFGDKYGVRGSRFSHIFGQSKNIPKSIVIDQESLISHLGIIKTPLKILIINWKTKKPKSTFLFAVCWALLDPVLGSIRPHGHAEQFVLSGSVFVWNVELLGDQPCFCHLGLEWWWRSKFRSCQCIHSALGEIAKASTEGPGTNWPNTKVPGKR